MTLRLWQSLRKRPGGKAGHSLPINLKGTPPAGLGGLKRAGLPDISPNTQMPCARKLFYMCGNEQ